MSKRSSTPVAAVKLGRREAAANDVDPMLQLVVAPVAFKEEQTKFLQEQAKLLKEQIVTERRLGRMMLTPAPMSKARILQN